MELIKDKTFGAFKPCFQLNTMLNEILWNIDLVSATRDI